jgi:LDH2 family malate/lactate/ureidoglycolate dehydrogenase
MLDFATTTAAGSKVLVAQQRGLPIPEGWMLDRHGNPTTDPGARDEGGVYLPFGGHKGYAIMLANELLGRVLTGSDAYAEPGRGGPVMRHQGVTFIVLKADLFRPLAEFAATADELGRRMRAVPPAPGFDEVLVPGDMEARARVERQRDGIPVPLQVWASLLEVAGSLGVDA